MTFEEQFPSLKGTPILYRTCVCGNIHASEAALNGREFFASESVEQFCLDKQRVSEAFDKLKDEILMRSYPDCSDGCCIAVDVSAVVVVIEIKKRELGL
jgi:hypothetical protein